VLVVALALGEIVARAFAPAAPPIRFQENEKMLEHIGRAQSASVLDYDPELFWRLKPDLVVSETDWPLPGRISNAQGFREDHEIPRAKPKGEVRALFLGDSCTFGTGLHWQDGFVNRTEVHLREKHPQAAIECINAGVPGYSVFQGWRFLETRGFAFDPDLVVITFGWNSIALWDTLGDREHYEAWRASRPPEILAWSRLAELAWKRPSAEQASDPEDGPRKLRLTPEEDRAVLQEIAGACRAHGVSLLVVVWPIPANFDPSTSTNLTPDRFLVQENARAFGRSLEFVPSGSGALVDLVEVARALFPEQGIAGLFQDHVHGTVLANDAYARAIAEKIEPWLAARL
jgi:lysophospholipase L1-like esterase